MIPVAYLGSNNHPKPIKVYAQQKDGWCGVAALQYALAEQGVEVTQENLVKETGTTQSEGVDPKPLAATARKHGMQVHIIEGQSLKKTLELLKFYKDNDYSIIIDYLAGKSIDDGHYVVVLKILSDKLEVYDPSNQGSTKMINQDYLIDHWIDKNKNGEIIKRFALVIYG